MADTCSINTAPNSGYSKAALRQLLGDFIDAWGSNTAADGYGQALGNLLNSFIDGLPDQLPVTEWEPGIAGSGSPGNPPASELDDGQLRFEVYGCGAHTLNEDAIGLCCDQETLPKRLHIWVPGLGQWRWANIPLLEYNGSTTPCRPPMYQLTIPEDQCATADVDPNRTMWFPYTANVYVEHTLGTAWSNDELDDLYRELDVLRSTVANLAENFVTLVRDLRDYYDLVWEQRCYVGFG